MQYSNQLELSQNFKFDSVHRVFESIGIHVCRTFPYRQWLPSEFDYLKIFLSISFFIRRDFPLPEFLIRLWEFEVLAVMAVPETAIDENDGFEFGEDDIGAAGQVSTVETESKTSAMEFSPNDQFWLCMLTFDASHHLTTLRG